MLAEEFGAAQALFLGGDRGEQHGTLGALRGGGIGARHFQQDAAAGGVVHRAVVDVVARLLGMDAEVVVMSAVEDGLILHPGIGAGQHGNHVL